MAKKTCFLYLNASFTQTGSSCQVLPCKGVRIVGPLENCLQGLQLVIGERRPVPSCALFSVIH